MRPKYTATDLFKLRKPMKLISIIEGMDETYVDSIFQKMERGKCIIGSLNSLKINLKDFFDQNMPGLSMRRLKIIADEYSIKKRERMLLGIQMIACRQKNRLLPLSNGEYNLFSRKSREHFRVVNKAYSAHTYGKER